MKIRRRFNVRRATTWLAGCLSAVLVLAAALWPAAADQSVGNQPVSGARALTPAGELVRDLTTRQPAVGALPVAFVRSPDTGGPGGAGRYLVAVNSGFGVQFSAATNRAQQSLAVLDLNARPAPAVVQNVYFPSPQSANVGLAFAPRVEADGTYPVYVSGGVENKIWVLRLRPGAPQPIAPTSSGPNTKVEAPFIDLTPLAAARATPRENNGNAPIYPTGLAVSADGRALFVANNLDDSLAVVTNFRDGQKPRLERITLTGQHRPTTREVGGGNLIYPYGVLAINSDTSLSKSREAAPDVSGKVYVSCWNDASIAVVNLNDEQRRVNYVPVARHPTAMLHDARRAHLYVVNANADSVSVIDTNADREVERIDVRLAENNLTGSSPESLALSLDGATLYVANAHSNSVAVVTLAPNGVRVQQGRITNGDDNRFATDNVEDVSSVSIVGDDKNQKNGDEGAESSSDKIRDIRGGVDNVSGADNGGRNHVSARAHAPQPEQPVARLQGRSKMRGFIPTGQYPTALALVGDDLFIGNGKGTGFSNSSLVVDNSGRTPNVANDRFPAGSGRIAGLGGEYSVAIVAGNISRVSVPDALALARYTRQVMRNNGLLDPPRRALFPGGRSPFKHVIYVIKENRTYDQVFGDLARAGDGQAADGDPSLAIFGAGEAARQAEQNTAQNVTPNQRALALRFGLLDRFFTNAEASADGHNWSTAAFSTDYTDKAFRWNYGGRGHGYDFEGFNRLPNVNSVRNAAPLFPRAVAPNDLADFMRRYVPYLNDRRDVAEPDTLYLWDAARRANLTYRNYGEFIGTVSAAEVAAINSNTRRAYPDLTPTVVAVPTKQALEGHHCTTFRNFDMRSPDALTVESYRAAKSAGGGIDPLISEQNADARWRGTSRLGEWLKEFGEYARDAAAGRPDRLPNLSIVRLSSDHTSGLEAGVPTPQFYVADNDYAVGRLVEAVSHSPYWRDTAILFVEDDAQDGPDHVDAHRSPALVVSAYNRPGAYVHTFHNTVSLLRTIEVLLNLNPMNQLDATAAPIDIFRAAPDLRPYTATLPDLALDNLLTPPARDAATAYWMRRTAEQDLEHPDQADAATLNRIIWYSVRGAGSTMPEIARLPLYDALLPTTGSDPDDEQASSTEFAFNPAALIRARRQARDVAAARP